MELLQATHRGNLERVQKLLRQGQDVNTKDPDGWTALMGAANKGHVEVVRFLLEHGAKIETKDKDGWTALMCATSNGHMEVVRLLVKSGADLKSAEGCFHSLDFYNEVLALSHWVKRRQLLSLRNCLLDR